MSTEVRGASELVESAIRRRRLIAEVERRRSIDIQALYVHANNGAARNRCTSPDDRKPRSVDRPAKRLRDGAGWRGGSRRPCLFRFGGGAFEGRTDSPMFVRFTYRQYSQTCGFSSGRCATVGRWSEEAASNLARVNSRAASAVDRCLTDERHGTALHVSEKRAFSLHPPVLLSGDSLCVYHAFENEERTERQRDMRR